MLSINNAFALSDFNVREFLDNRENLWPELYLPNFQFSDTSKDLIYPNWFEGNWLVTSEDLTNVSEKPVVYEVNFFKNKSNLLKYLKISNLASIILAMNFLFHSKILLHYDH